MANGKLFNEVGDIIDSGEVPQKVSNRLLFALVMRLNEIVVEIKTDNDTLKKTLHGELGTTNVGLAAAVEINEDHITTNSKKLLTTNRLLTGIVAALVLDFLSKFFM